MTLATRAGIACGIGYAITSLVGCMYLISRATFPMEFVVPVAIWFAPTMGAILLGATLTLMRIETKTVDQQTGGSKFLSTAGVIAAAIPPFSLLIVVYLLIAGMAVSDAWEFLTELPGPVWACIFVLLILIITVPGRKNRQQGR